jgi:enoyl-CoA hydratase/carnithine racemase
MTGWGGTQRLPRLIGKSRALQMFVAAKTMNAEHALIAGLVASIEADPIAAAERMVQSMSRPSSAIL